MRRLIIALAALLAIGLLVWPRVAHAGAEGPGTPQATAANATFLSNAPAPPGGAGAVCVVDSGVDTNTDLGSALAARTTMLGSDLGDLGAVGDQGTSMAKHGTYVAGVIASQIDGVGTSGIWPAARVSSVRVFAGGSSATAADYIRAMDWCASSSATAKVINLSLSGLMQATNVQRQALEARIAQYRSAPYNINVVAAAGNNGSMVTVGYPAVAPEVFAVGATDAGGRLTGFSNRGSGLDLATLGINTCLTTSAGTHLALGAGTSYAAPVVSAVLAALRSYNPALSPDAAEQLLLTHSDSVEGLKVLNAAKAFRADPSVAPLTGDAPVSGLNISVANPCEAAQVAGGDHPGSAVGPDSRKGPPRPEPSTPTMILADPAIPPLVDVQMPRAVAKARRPQRLTLKSVAFRRGLLTVRISGRESGERALFYVDRVRFLRAGNTLRVRLETHRWKTIRVQLLGADGEISQTVTVRSHREF